MNAETRAALERLFKIAIHHDSGTSGRVANFLLAWWNARENGGFDFTDLWQFDHTTLSDCMLVLQYVSSHCTYHEEEFGGHFRKVHELWRAPKKKRSESK